MADEQRAHPEDAGFAGSGAVRIGEGAVVRARGVHHAYSSDDGRLSVLADCDLDVAAGEVVAVRGASGAGKTTLLALLGGLERADAGVVEVDGVDLGTLRGDALAAYRRSTVGFVFQDFGLLPMLTALENVELALVLASVSGRERRRRARSLLDAVGLTARATHRPAQLSGGEQQRVAVARALANRPRLVLADEPTGNLDADATAAVLDLVLALPGDHGCTVVIVTHDPGVAAHAGRAVHLAAGALAAA